MAKLPTAADLDTPVPTASGYSRTGVVTYKPSGGEGLQIAGKVLGDYADQQIEKQDDLDVAHVGSEFTMAYANTLNGLDSDPDFSKYPQKYAATMNATKEQLLANVSPRVRDKLNGRLDSIIAGGMDNVLRKQQVKSHDNIKADLMRTNDDLMGHAVAAGTPADFNVFSSAYNAKTQAALNAGAIDETQKYTLDKQFQKDAVMTRVKSLANTNVMSAYDEYKTKRDLLTPEEQVSTDAFFVPKIRDYQSRTIADNTLSDYKQKYTQSVTGGVPANAAPVDTIMKNEIQADGKITMHSDGDGNAIGGINSNAYPAQYAEAKNILETKGQDEAKKYISNFYQKEIVDKNGVGSLPKDVQTVVADGLANHWSGFQKDLLDAAKNGASAQQLIDMRRNEYQRLATENPDKYGKNLEGWNNRLDRLQSASGIPTKGIMPSEADYYRLNSQNILDAAREKATTARPDDPAFVDSTVSRLSTYMNTAISNQERAYKVDYTTLQRAIKGDFTNGTAPTTVEDLKKIPQVGDAYDRLAQNDWQLSQAIDNKLLTANAKSGDKDIKEGGKSFYDFWKRANLPVGDPNRPTPLEVVNAVGNGLTRTGHDHIMDVLNGKDDSIEKYMKPGIEYMKAAIDPMGLNDGEARKKTAKMTFDFRESVQKGLAEGKTLQELTDPASKNFAGLVSKGDVPTNDDVANRILATHNEVFAPYHAPWYHFSFAPAYDSSRPIPFEENFRKAVAEGHVTKANGFSLLKEAMHTGAMDKWAALKLAQEMGFTEVKQPVETNGLYTPEVQ